MTKHPLSLWAVDAMGAVLATACAAGILWFTTIRVPQTGDDILKATSVLRERQKDLILLRDVRDRQFQLVVQRRNELARVGHLPENAVVDAYFQELARLASIHEITVLRNDPLSSQTYPGLFEQRFAFEISGTFHDLVRFLRAIESTDFWADVSYLKLQKSPKGQIGEADARAAELTVSLFSAAPSTPATGG